VAKTSYSERLKNSLSANDPASVSVEGIEADYRLQEQIPSHCRKPQTG